MKLLESINFITKSLITKKEVSKNEKGVNITEINLKFFKLFIIYLVYNKNKNNSDTS